MLENHFSVGAFSPTLPRSNFGLRQMAFASSGIFSSPAVRFENPYAKSYETISADRSSEPIFPLRGSTDTLGWAHLAENSGGAASSGPQERALEMQLGKVMAEKDYLAEKVRSLQALLSDSQEDGSTHDVLRSAAKIERKLHDSLRSQHQEHQTIMNRVHDLENTVAQVEGERVSTSKKLLRAELDKEKLEHIVHESQAELEELHNRSVVFEEKEMNLEVQEGKIAQVLSSLNTSLEHHLPVNPVPFVDRSSSSSSRMVGDQLNALQRNIKREVESKVRLEEDIRGFSTMVAETQAELEKSRSELYRTERQRDILKRNNEELEASGRMFKGEVDIQRENLHSMEEAIRRKNKENMELEGNLEELESSKQKLVQEKQQAEQYSQEMLSVMKELQRDLLLTKSHLQKLQEQQHMQQTENNQRNETVEKLRDAQSRLEFQLAQGQEEKKGAASRVATLEAEVQQLWLSRSEYEKNWSNKMGEFQETVLEQVRKTQSEGLLQREQTHLLAV